MSRTTPPGPPPVRNNPVALLRYARAFGKDPVAFVGGRFERYGDLYASVFRGTPLYVTRHPEHLEEILVRRGADFAKPTSGLAAKQLRRFLGDGLVMSNGETWKRHRRLINPAFGRKRVESFGPMMVERTRRLAEGWQPEAQIEVGQAMMRLTLEIVTKALFDHEVRGEADTVARSLDAFRDLGGRPQLLPDWAPIPRYRRTRQALRDVNSLMYGLIDLRARESEGRLGERTDLLSALILAADEQGKMSREHLRDELLTLFFAGHETTAQALTWTWYLLSRHPEVEAKLHAELDEVLGDRDPTVEDLKELPYTARVIDESMRVFPPVATLARVSTRDTEVGGYPVPAGSDVICWIWHAHRDPRWWARPDDFDPDHFLPEQSAERPKLAYLPFGAGQRLCIGKGFALMEARLILATLARRVRLRLAPGHPVEPRFAVTTSPRHGMPMTVEARER